MITYHFISYRRKSVLNLVEIQNIYEGDTGYIISHDIIYIISHDIIYDSININMKVIL